MHLKDSIILSRRYFSNLDIRFLFGVTLLLQSRVLCQRPGKLVRDVARKIYPSKGMWPTSHGDLGGIRTESATRPSPPEKKERQGEKGPKKRLGNSKAPKMYIFVV